MADGETGRRSTGRQDPRAAPPVPTSSVRRRKERPPKGELPRIRVPVASFAFPRRNHLCLEQAVDEDVSGCAFSSTQIWMGCLRSVFQRPRRYISPGDG